MSFCHSQQSFCESQKLTKSNQHVVFNLIDQASISRITLHFTHNSATDEDIDNINEKAQSNNTQKNEIETNHEQASIELRTSNINIFDLNLKFVKSVNQVKIFIFVEALVRKNQILNNSKLIKFNQFFSVCLLCKKYIQQCEN